MLKSAFKRVSGGQNIPLVCCKRRCPAGQAEKVGCARLPLAPPAFAFGLLDLDTLELDRSDPALHFLLIIEKKIYKKLVSDNSTCLPIGKCFLSTASGLYRHLPLYRRWYATPLLLPKLRFFLPTVFPTLRIRASSSGLTCCYPPKAFQCLLTCNKASRQS